MRLKTAGQNLILTTFSAYIILGEKEGSILTVLFLTLQKKWEQKCNKIQDHSPHNKDVLENFKPLVYWRQFTTRAELAFKILNCLV